MDIAIVTITFSQFFDCVTQISINGRSINIDKIDEERF